MSAEAVAPAEEAVAPAELDVAARTPARVTQILFMVGSRILVRPVAAPEQIGAMVVPDAVRDEHRLLEGVVIIAGPTCTQIIPGDIVRYGPHNGQKVDVDGEELLVLMEAEALMAWRTEPEKELLEQP